MSAQTEISQQVKSYLATLEIGDLEKDLQTAHAFQATYGYKKGSTAEFLKKYKNVQKQCLLLYLYQIEIHTEDAHREDLIRTLQEFFIQAQQEQTEDQQRALDFYHFLESKHRLKPQTSQQQSAVLNDINSKLNSIFDDDFDTLCNNLKIDKDQQTELTNKMKQKLTPDAIIQRKARAIDATKDLAENIDFPAHFTRKYCELRPEVNQPQVNEISECLKQNDSFGFTHRTQDSLASRFNRLETLFDVIQDLASVSSENFVTQLKEPNSGMTIFLCTLTTRLQECEEIFFQNNFLVGPEAGLINSPRPF